MTADLPVNTRDPAEAPALETRNLSKTYGPTRALIEASISVRRGEVRALLGKNGAGKSTFVNLISGTVQPDPGGMLLVDGDEVRYADAAAARDGGIAVVHQELSLVPGLSVAENITLGRWPRKRRMIDRDAMTEVARAALSRVGEDLPLDREAGRLPLAQQQLVEIAKAVAYDARVLVLDEPTSSLNRREADALLAMVRRLAATGVAVLYVSHRMQEIPRVADTLTVLRDGREVTTVATASVTPVEVAEFITGDVVVDAERRFEDRRSQPTVLAVEDMRDAETLRGVSFEVHEGEVLGIAGLLGSGRSELLEAIYGARHDIAGRVSLAGVEFRRRSPDASLRRGIGFTPEDRKDAGIIPWLGVGENLMLAARGRTLRGPWIRPSAETTRMAELIESLGIATASAAKQIDALSGGNQQKAVIGRMLAAGLRVLLLDEPTRGVDVHAKARIYELVRSLAAEGMACVFVSSELEELPEVCDRVLVLRNGRITDELTGHEATPDRLLALAMKEDDVVDH